MSEQLFGVFREHDISLQPPFHELSIFSDQTTEFPEVEEQRPKHNRRKMSSNKTT